jgi:tyrosinase
MVSLPAILLLFTSLTSAFPGLPHLVETIQKRAPQSGNAPTPTTPFAVTGVMTNSVEPRLEIRQLASDTDQFNIFILGLQALQHQSESYFLSYYELSTIHGAPSRSWDGVQGVPGGPQVFPGYCTHQSNVFLPWHRPYLALYEVSWSLGGNVFADLQSKCSRMLRNK